MLEYSNWAKPPRIGDQVDLEMLEYSTCTKPTQIGDQVEFWKCKSIDEYSNQTKPTRISHPMMSFVVFISFRRLLCCIHVRSCSFHFAIIPCHVQSCPFTMHWPNLIIVFVIVLMWFRRPVQVDMSGFMNFYLFKFVIFFLLPFSGPATHWQW